MNPYKLAGSKLSASRTYRNWIRFQIRNRNRFRQMDHALRWGVKLLGYHMLTFIATGLQLYKMFKITRVYFFGTQCICYVLFAFNFTSNGTEQPHLCWCAVNNLLIRLLAHMAFMLGPVSMTLKRPWTTVTHHLAVPYIGFSGACCIEMNEDWRILSMAKW